MTESPELREIRERDLAAGREYHQLSMTQSTPPFERCMNQATVDRRHLLQELALRDARIAELSNELQATQCSEQMLKDDVRAANVRIAELEKDALRYRYLHSLCDGRKGSFRVSHLVDDKDVLLMAVVEHYADQFIDSCIQQRALSAKETQRG